MWKLYANIWSASVGLVPGMRLGFGHLFLTELFKGAGDTDVPFQMRNIRNTNNRNRCGVAQDVGQQFLGAKTPFAECTTGNHFQDDHTNYVFIGKVAEPNNCITYTRSRSGGSIWRTRLTSTWTINTNIQKTKFAEIFTSFSTLSQSSHRNFTAILYTIMS